MPKYIIIASLTLLFAAMPIQAESVWSMSEQTAQQSEVTETKFYVYGQNVRIVNGGGQMLEVFNLTGVRINAFRIDSEDTTVSLNLPKGIYILKVGKVVRKVSIR